MKRIRLILASLSFFAVRDGVCYLSTQSYGTAAPLLYTDKRYQWVDLGKSLLIDVFAFKANGETAIFRIGTGGEKSDRIIYKA